MTKAEWLACNDPAPMLEHFRDSPQDRKLRLLACAASRSVLTPFLSAPMRRTVSAAEAVADGLVPTDELKRLHPGAIERAIAVLDAHNRAAGNPDLGAGYFIFAAEAVAHTTGEYPWHTAAQALPAAALAACDAPVSVLPFYHAGHFSSIAIAPRFDGSGHHRTPISCHIDPSKIPLRDMPLEYTDELASQAHLLRCIFGNPFRPITFSPSWRTSTVVALAAGMYESRDFSAMLILADALQDAGCDRAEVLEHCRGGGPHVRGCWVVDQLLEKA